MLNNTGLSQNSTTNRPTSHMLVYIGHVYAYGPKTEVTKRFFFESEVLDATLMMGWGGVGHVNVCVNLLRFLMLRWWWGGVGHVNVRVNLLRFLMLRWWWGGVGHVNVRVNLLRFLMLRWWWGGVGWGMLTFVWTCWGSWCYADDGVGWGGAC